MLLVEDDELVAQSMLRVLRTKHEARLSDGLLEALEEVERRPPDVLITDYYLPPYFGSQLLAVAGRDYPRIIRIAYSGHDAAGLAHLVELGLADRVLEKAYVADELLRAIASLVENQLLSRDETTGAGAQPTPSRLQGRGGEMPRIAIIEDDQQQQRIYASALQAAGYEVRIWTGAGGATNEIRPWDPDAIVVDAKLRGLQGDSFIQIAKKNLRPGIHFILHSNMDPADLIRTARLLDCDCVPKDREARGLIRKLNAIFAAEATR